MEETLRTHSQVRASWKVSTGGLCSDKKSHSLHSGVDWNFLQMGCGGWGGAREPWEKWSGKVGWHKVGEQKQRKGRRSNAREVQTLSNFKSTECLICNKEGKKCLSLHLTPGGGFWQPHLRFGCMCQTQDKEGRQEVCWISGSSAFLEFSPTSEQLRGITH